jgi:hypothetical protein
MRIVLLSLFCITHVISYSQKELINVYEKSFNPDKLLQVKEIDNHYFIVSSVFMFDKTKNTSKLSLLSKAILFQYLKKRDKKITSLELKNFKNAFSWKKNKKEYLFSFISKSSVKYIYTKAKNTKSNDIIYKEIKLESIDKKSIMIHEQLKSLYFQISDMKHYNIQIDKIMEAKFHDF